MLNFRLIPILTIIDEDLVKTKNFNKPKYVGDPLNAVRIFNDKFVDEIIVLDIGEKNQSPNFKFIFEVAAECFMPLTYGGKIKSIEHANSLFELGVEKISLNSLLYSDTEMVKNLVNEFGSSSIVASIDYKLDKNGRAYAFNRNFKNFNYELKYMVNKVQSYGVGELLLTSINCEGLMNGYDNDIIDEINNIIEIPLVYNGGISNDLDIIDISKKQISGVGVGSYFVFFGPHEAVLIHYPKIDFNEK